MESLLEKDFHRTIRSEFPYGVEKLREMSILVDNHIKLAATIWMPKSRIYLFLIPLKKMFVYCFRKSSSIKR